MEKWRYGSVLSFVSDFIVERVRMSISILSFVFGFCSAWRGVIMFREVGFCFMFSFWIFKWDKCYLYLEYCCMEVEGREGFLWMGIFCFFGV